MIRKVIKDSYDLYDVHLSSFSPISNNSYKCKSDDGGEYILKTTELYTSEKFKFLYNQGIENVLYPIKNRVGDYISRSDKNFYMTNYIPDFYMLDEIKAVSLAKELDQLHTHTYFRRQLSPSNSRRKMDDTFDYLQYKFSMLELFIRTIETRDFDEYSITFLKNYQVLLDTKKIMAKLQKKIIGDIKDRKSIYFAYIHNNPKLDHLLSSGGNQFLISIEKSKIGIPSLDIAKFYLENVDVNIDMKTIIESYFAKFDDEFYFDYFCFIVLLYYIKGIVIIDKDYVSSQSFLYATSSIKKFINTFDLLKEKPII